MLPYVIAIGLGALIGALIGLLVSQLLLGRGSSSGARPAGASRSSAVTDDARWITARYNGVCHSCGSSIAVGDRVLHRPRQTRCVSCA